MSDQKRYPYIKWYARDWRGDGALRGCSFAARGLWADLLSVMHDEGEPYGHLRINGTDPDIARLGRMLGGSVREIEKLLAELEMAGVPSRTPEGTIYSRRMVRDKAKADADKENGKGGGNPKLKHKDNTGVNPSVKAQIPEPEPTPKNQEGVKPAGAGTSHSKPSRNAGYSADFEAFWKAYPRNKNMEKKPAFRQWERLSPEKRAAAAAAIPAFRKFCEENKGWYHPVYPERFLSKEKFEGYADEPGPTPEEIEVAKDRADRLLKRGKYAPNYGGTTQ